jgi:hypothetical protein
MSARGLFIAFARIVIVIAVLAASGSLLQAIPGAWHFLQIKPGMTRPQVTSLMGFGAAGIGMGPKDYSVEVVRYTPGTVEFVNGRVHSTSPKWGLCAL